MPSRKPLHPLQSDPLRIAISRKAQGRVEAQESKDEALVDQQLARIGKYRHIVFVKDVLLLGFEQESVQ